MSTDQKAAFRAVRIFFTGVGGQGTLLATRLVGEAALEMDLPVTMSEIHGMAQRGGVVESSVVVGDASSPTITNAEADILLAFEPLEAARALPRCHARSIVITNTVPIVPFTVAIRQSTYPDLESLYALIEGKVARLIRVDAVRMAREAGTERAANIAMVGVLAGTGILPVPRESWHAGLELVLPPRLLEVNRRAFDLGFTAGTEVAALDAASNL